MSTDTAAPVTPTAASVPFMRPDPAGKHWYFGELQDGYPSGFGCVASPFGLFEGDVRVPPLLLFETSAQLNGASLFAVECKVSLRVAPRCKRPVDCVLLNSFG